MKESDFVKANNFKWFTGVVEDINDPEELGRVKVRIFGYHTAEKIDIKTEDLPWATCMSSIDSAAMTQIGRSNTGLLHGSWVVGFFRDGVKAQDPLIMGTIASQSTYPESFEIGFTDPDQIYPIEDFCDEPDMSRSARTKEEIYKETDMWKSKVDSQQMHGSEIPTAREGEEWNVKKPEDYIAPKYPANKVIQTYSGHVIERDDTEDKERLGRFHKTGTFVEVDNEGDQTEVIVGNHFQVVVKDKNVYVKGHCNLTVDMDVRTLVKGDYHLEVEGDRYELIHGNTLVETKGDITETTDGNHEVETGGDYKESIGGKHDEETSGDHNIKASNIFLN
jgi:hypothetical protein